MTREAHECCDCGKCVKSAVPSLYWKTKEGGIGWVCLPCHRFEQDLEEAGRHRWAIWMATHPCPFDSVKEYHDGIRQMIACNGGGRTFVGSIRSDDDLWIMRWKKAFAENHQEELSCPKCGARHVESDLNRLAPHKTHVCESCKAQWDLEVYAFGMV